MNKKETEKGKTNKSGKNKKHVVVILTLLAVFIILVVVLGIIFSHKIKKGQNRDFPFGNRQNGELQFTMTQDMVATSGVTSAGVTEVRFEVENLDTALKIEEVYISSETAITEGTKVLKISEESVAEARKELEQTLKEANLASRAGAIEYEQSKINAEYDRDSKILEGKQAKTVYDETISGLSSSVKKAKEELLQAQEDIAEYQSYVNNDSYKSYFKVEEYQATYDKTLEALMAKMEEWGVSWPQVTGQGGGTGMGKPNFSAGAMTVSVSGGDSVQSQGPTNEQIQVLASLYDVLEVQGKNLDQAKSDYQAALDNAAFELQTLQLQLPKLENALIEAEKNYKNQLLQAELTYQTSLANAESAEEDYETNMEQAETTYESLKKAQEDAKENLELFEKSVGDGYFYASGSGTILRTMVRAGQTLSSEATIFMFSNSQEMTVAVSIDQTDISKVSLNDSVYIQTAEFGGFEGTVKEVNVISDSESRTNVTYTVIVQFDRNASEIGANESVTVIFGMDAETIKGMTGDDQKSENKDQGMPEGFTPGEMPEGFAPGERPEGFDPGQMPQGGERPSRPSGEFDKTGKGNKMEGPMNESSKKQREE